MFVKIIGFSCVSTHVQFDLGTVLTMWDFLFLTFIFNIYYLI